MTQTTRVMKFYSKFRSLARSEAGLTLIEMTVVIAIIAVIASMALPSVRGLIFEGRSTGKAADLREMTITVSRYLHSERAFPTDSGVGPPVDVQDANLDDVVRLVLDTANPDGGGTPPSGVDAMCLTASTDLADATSQCFLAIDFAKTREFIFNLPEHWQEDVLDEDGSTPRFDDDVATADFTATAANLEGVTIEIYVLDDGGPTGTPFPTGALRVWNIGDDGRPWALKSDDAYGKD